MRTACPFDAELLHLSSGHLSVAELKKGADTLPVQLNTT